MSEIKFPPDVPYRAVTDKIKIVKDPWYNQTARDISEVVRLYYEEIKKEKQS